MQGMKAIAAHAEKTQRTRFVAVLALACMAAGLLLAAQAGCSCSSGPGGGDDPYRRITGAELEALNEARRQRAAKEAEEAAKARAAAEAAKKRKQEEHRKRVEAERIKREQQQREWQAKVEVEQKMKAEPEKPKFPENPADWTKDDFPKARAAGEPKLVDAVNHLGEMFPTSEPAVATLVSLLKPAGKPADQKLIEAIVRALGRNETPQATQALRDLVDGKLETEHPSIARSKALGVLAERDPSLFDELMLAGLRTADDDQRAAGATRGVYDWEDDLLKLIDERAGPELRVRVARYALEPGTSVRQREKLLELLTRAVPANLSAQVILLASPTTDAAAKPRLAQQLAMVSSCTLQQLQGMPASITPTFAVAAGRPARQTATYGVTSYGESRPAAKTAAGGAVAVFEDPNLLRYAPDALWSDAAVDLVVESLYHLERLDQAPHDLQLAVTIPVGRVRAELLEALRRHWQDGPEGLRKAGIPQEIIFDPALAALLRTLPHASPDAREWRRQLSAGIPRPSDPGKEGIGTWHPLHRQQADDTVLEFAWAELLGETMWTLATRLQAAAEVELAMRGTEATIDAAQRHTPIPLHENARIVAFHSASLPGPLAESSDDVRIDPVRLRYVRMVDNVSLQRTVGHYIRNMHEPAVFMAWRTGWLTSLERDESAGTLRSVDVFIRRTSNTLYSISDPAERLIIQVVCIECVDPAAEQSPGSSQQSSVLTEN